MTRRDDNEALIDHSPARGKVVKLRSSKRRPVVLLIRVTHPVPHWEMHSRHRNMAEAERFYGANVRGRGITAWAWWGPEGDAKRMLADASLPTRELSQ